VKLKSTNGSLEFYLLNLKKDQWVENFRMSKSSFFKIIENLKPTLSKQNTIIDETKACCSIYKLPHDVNFLIYNELFAIKKSIVLCGSA
jgi:hypothetical protein